MLGPPGSIGPCLFLAWVALEAGERAVGTGMLPEVELSCDRYSCLYMRVVSLQPQSS